MIALTIAGLMINTIPEWRIIDDQNALPIVAFWSAINTVVLFLVCMLSLQAPLRRGEERLELDEPIWLVTAAGTILTGRTKDLSLSGAGFELDRHGAFSPSLGDRVRVFLSEVGFVAATVARQQDRFIGVAFALPPSVERDLLIRKLFTIAIETAEIAASAWSSTAAMLRSIWDVRTEIADQAEERVPGVVIDFPVERLPARSLVLSPRPGLLRLAEIGAARRTFAA
jgi:cellulose synthase (UDP-forming)